jgi:hypothetical protein
LSRGHTRTRRITVRLSENDYNRLVERAAASGAKTAAAYLRAAALTGQEFEMPPWEHLRALINAMVQCTGELRKAGASPAVEAKAIDAFDRISQL